MYGLRFTGYGVRFTMYDVRGTMCGVRFSVYEDKANYQLKRFTRAIKCFQL